jgi:hypothetical protein
MDPDDPARPVGVRCLGGGETADREALVIRVGATTLRYLLRGIDGLHAMLVEHGDWMPLGNADEQ